MTVHSHRPVRIEYEVLRMRVIAGSARRLALKTIEGMETRPTTDRIKETLFNMLNPRLYDCQFLDLFSGSGAIGIEALSRGAARAVFVEKHPKAVQVIKDNLAFTRLADKAIVMPMDVKEALRRLEEQKAHFDLIFMDPPYHQGLEREVLEILQDSCLIDGDSLIVVEASRETDFSYLESLGMELLRQKEYKTNQHVFVRRLAQS